MSNKLIEICDLTAGYQGIAAIEHVNLTIYEHDYIGVIGPNGGGKTTLVKTILGLVKPMAGSVRCDGVGHDLRVGYLPQMTSLDRQFPLSARELVLTGLQGVKHWWQGYSRGDRLRADELLTSMGASHLGSRATSSLSGGELQRVLLARALMCDPRLLLLDEPTTYVDDKFEREFYEILKSLTTRLAIVMVSHDLGTICSYVKSIACVNHTLHYHPSNMITAEQLELYDCPIQLLEHGAVAHTVLKKHETR
ncbi:MAG: ABC transporter ATP-binding protein [Mucinivorans sp.]